MYIIQIISNTDRSKNGLSRLGKGHVNAIRFVPYNPLTYFVLIITFFVILCMYGIKGCYKHLYNPFKWD